MLNSHWGIRTGRDSIFGGLFTSLDDCSEYFLLRSIDISMLYEMNYMNLKMIHFNEVFIFHGKSLAWISFKNHLIHQFLVMMHNWCKCTLWSYFCALLTELFQNENIVSSCTFHIIFAGSNIPEIIGSWILWLYFNAQPSCQNVNIFSFRSTFILFVKSFRYRSKYLKLCNCWTPWLYFNALSTELFTKTWKKILMH